MRIRLGIIVALIASSANADFYDGNKIYPLCETDKSLIGMYIAGWTDKQQHDYYSLAMAGASISTPTNQVTVNSLMQGVDANICIPPGEIRLSQMVDVLCTYLTEHPETRQLAMSEQLRLSLSGAWPCRK